MDNELKNGYLITVGVDVDKSGAPGHFVLVTGNAVNPDDGTDDYSVDDPGDQSTKYLSEFKNFVIRGAVESSIDEEDEVHPHLGGGDRSVMSIALDGNADLIISDSSGALSGRDPRVNQTYDNIPTAHYFQDRIDNDVTGAIDNFPVSFIGVLPKNWSSSNVTLS